MRIMLAWGNLRENIYILKSVLIKEYNLKEVFSIFKEPYKNKRNNQTWMETI